MRIYKSIKEPITQCHNPSYEVRWKQEDKGLITSWEVGRILREDEPELAEFAEQGILLRLGWKGGIVETEKDKETGRYIIKEESLPTTQSEKFGTLHYLAQWQGLLGKDLDIDTSKVTELVCSKTGIKVIFCEFRGHNIKKDGPWHETQDRKS